MSLIKPDFSEVKDNVGPGTYNVRITGATTGEWESKSGGAPTGYINWELVTFGEDDSKNNGRKIWNRTPTNGKGAFRLQQFYKAAMGEDLKGPFDYEMLFGREITVVITDGKNRDGSPTGYTEVASAKPLAK